MQNLTVSSCSSGMIVPLVTSLRDRFGGGPKKASIVRFCDILFRQYRALLVKFNITKHV